MAKKFNIANLTAGTKGDVTITQSEAIYSVDRFFVISFQGEPVARFNLGYVHGVMWFCENPNPATLPLLQQIARDNDLYKSGFGFILKDGVVQLLTPEGTEALTDPFILHQSQFGNYNAWMQRIAYTQRATYAAVCVGLDPWEGYKPMKQIGEKL